MVRRSLIPLALAAVALTAGCGTERDMPERLEMPDTMDVVRAMHDEAVRDSLMDVMPGGEMVRGDSAAAMELLERKR
ncbi:MAG: hypothetical protein PVI31_05715 [Gemmatimonadota bacterium]|jgi:hypothetical protein